MIEKVECEQCLFSSKTVGTTQNKHGIMTAMPLGASNTEALEDEQKERQH